MRVKGFLLDVEGVLVADKRYQAVEGAVEFVGALRDRGVPFRLITNNTTHTQPMLVEKLGLAGFDFTLDEVHTCTVAAVAHLRESEARRCLVLGTDTLRRFFADEGFAVADASDVDAVVVGLDEDLTYERLRLACDAVARNHATLIALHRNRLYTDDQGRCGPSVGAIVEAIHYATGAEPVVIGKPSPIYFRQTLNDLGVAAGSVMVVSDDPFSDLAGARRIGMSAALVLSGKYNDPQVTEQISPGERPNVIVKRIGDLLTEKKVKL